MLNTMLSFYQCGHWELSLISAPDTPVTKTVLKWNANPATSSVTNPSLLDNLSPYTNTNFTYGPCWHQLCQITDPTWIAEQDAAKPLGQAHRQHTGMLEQCLDTILRQIHRFGFSRGLDNVEAADRAIIALNNGRTGLERMNALTESGGARFVWEGTRLIVGKYIKIGEAYVHDQIRQEVSNPRPKMFFDWQIVPIASAPKPPPPSYPPPPIPAPPLSPLPDYASTPSSPMPPPPQCSFVLSKPNPRKRKLAQLFAPSPTSEAFFPAPFLKHPPYTPVTLVLQQVEDELRDEWLIRRNNAQLHYQHMLEAEAQNECPECVSRRAASVPTGICLTRKTIQAELRTERNMQVSGAAQRQADTFLDNLSEQIFKKARMSERDVEPRRESTKKARIDQSIYVQNAMDLGVESAFAAECARDLRMLDSMMD